MICKYIAQGAIRVGDFKLMFAPKFNKDGWYILHLLSIIIKIIFFLGRIHTSIQGIMKNKLPNRYNPDARPRKLRMVVSPAIVPYPKSQLSSIFSGAEEENAEETREVKKGQEQRQGQG